MKMKRKVEYKINHGGRPMTINLTDLAKGAFDAVDAHHVWGRVAAIDGGVVHVTGLSGLARIGDRILIAAKDGDAPAQALGQMPGQASGQASDQASGCVAGEVIAMRSDELLVMPEASLSGMSPGDRAYLRAESDVFPSEEWIGEILSSDGTFFDGRRTPKGERPMALNPAPTPATARRGLGARLDTGLAPFDTFLPICRGQRIGLFAGSGVGKSSLIAALAQGVDADIVIVALIGERSREVREFAEGVFRTKSGARAIIVASTCDEPAPAKRRGALLAMTAAEYFRDQGLHVLLLFDSITRFADAHREIALTAGETPSLRAYPPSTFRAVASLAERTGPGLEGEDGAGGDITAVFSVLVAGSDMDEPVADMVRGILDGHVVLDRDIAERGRFPAINVRRSVSRSLPHAASDEENATLLEARRLIAAYDDAAAMIQTGLYARGSDPVIDRALTAWPGLDAFVSETSPTCKESFAKLNAVLNAASGDGPNGN